MDAVSPGDDINVIMRRSAARQWGLGLFFSCGMLCAIAARLVYLSTYAETGVLTFWIAAFFCGLPYLVACIGFIMAVSAVPCTQLHKGWLKLRRWQQILVVSFAVGAFYIFMFCACFIVSLLPTSQINGQGL